MYEGQGVPTEAAKQSAKEAFSKAQAQSAEKVLQIEEIRIDKTSEQFHSTATVRVGNLVEEVDMTERESAVSEIEEKFGVSEDEAETLFERVEDKIGDEV